MSTLFRLSNFLVMPFWGLMIFLPRWRWTVRIMRSPFVSVAPAALYAALVLPRLDGIWPAISRPRLHGVAALLGSPEGAAIAWVHFLAFDLFVGRWIYLDSQERRFSAWLTGPILFLTLMLGPFGFLSYLMVGAAARFVPGGAKEQLYSRWREASTVSRPLTILGGAMLLIFLAALAGVLLDHRVITGAPAWLKPAKFAISTSVYCFTFVWLLGFIQNRPRAVRLAANLTAVGLMVEVAVIIAQAARGTTSHFNMTTPLNSFLWMAMAVFIVVVWAMSFLAAVLLIRQRMPNRAFVWSLRLAVLISLAGMAIGFFMVRPTPGQRAAVATGHGLPLVGAHTVGAADGGPGLPIVGWSTVGGDLRVPHFVGLHALQVLPFLGWIVTRRGAFRGLAGRHRLHLVWTGGLGYLGLVLILVWQALRGQPAIHPDNETFAAMAALASLMAISVFVTFANAQRSNKNQRELTLHV